MRNENGCPYCNNTNKTLCASDDCEMCYKNSFATHDMMEEWDYIKNKDINPKKLIKFSNKKYFFICKNGHSRE